MTRVKKGVNALKTRRNILRQAKGYRFDAFAHRRDKKNDFRRLWNVKINAFVRSHQITYSKFIGLLKKKGIGLDRKILAALAESKPETFARLLTHLT
ncbi:MAG: 50S ribosomal protein L20 [Parcubacteria group bacterium GW2011_GWB1_44_7]|nr:MAG: 50S ribosomal protein L20 [Parcubacteria group bacterium GW2011_GWB1_44_7]